MQDYELVMLISPQVADEQVPAMVDRVTEFIKGRGGTVAEVKPWGRRHLAYHIKDFEEATFVQANFSLEPRYVVELRDSLGVWEEVIRHLLVKEDTKALVTPKPGVAGAPILVKEDTKTLATPKTGAASVPILVKEDTKALATPKTEAASAPMG